MKANGILAIWFVFILLVLSGCATQTEKSSPALEDRVASIDQLLSKGYNAQYGGVYLADSRIHVLIVKPTDEIKNKILSLPGSPDTIVIESAEFSKAELNNLRDLLASDNELKSIVSSLGVDIKQNRVLVSLTAENEKNKEMVVNKTTNSLALVFIETPKVSLD